jgi:transcriptional regulator with XRE-family HTH domain
MTPSRIGRPPSGGPPTRFTENETFTGTPRWLVRESDQAGEVAAAFAQQQLIANIRRQRGLGMSAADAAEQLGRARNDRTVLNVWSGRSAISLQMLLALALAFDVTPLEHCDQADITTLLPEPHRSWLGSWRPGSGSPSFQNPTGPEGEPVWRRAAQQVARWIFEEAKVQTLHLATDAVATHAASAALMAAGLPVELASLIPGPHGASHLRYEATHEIDVRVILLHENDGPSHPRLLRTVRQLWDFRRAADHRAVVILAAAPREARRLEPLLPGYLDAVDGEAVRIPPATLRAAGVPDEDASLKEFEMIQVADDVALNSYVVRIYQLTKSF